MVRLHSVRRPMRWLVCFLDRSARSGFPEEDDLQLGRVYECGELASVSPPTPARERKWGGLMGVTASQRAFAGACQDG